MVKSRKINKGMGIVLFSSILFLSITTLLNVTGLNCLAGNYHDKLFTYNINKDVVEVTDVITTFENKEDKTCSYIHNNTSNGTISYIRVCGSFDGDGWSDCTDTDISKGHWYESCAVGQSKLLYNWVFESHFPKAALLFDPGDGHHNYISILWSPDSI